MEITRRKALYLFLSSLLGILLLLMFHRSVFVIYELLGNFFPSIAIFHLDFRFVATMDFFTMLIAMFIGGWYGIWLGLHWYKIVYEDRATRSWFHGFVPHHFRSKKVKDNPTAIAASGVPKTLTATSAPTDGFQTIRPSASIKSVWSFDDFNKPDTAAQEAAKKQVNKKPAAKKRVRKVAKKSVEPEIE
jgi:hypothetical protein